MGESEIYSPYSFWGSEAGHDVAQGDPNDGSNHHHQVSSKLFYFIFFRKSFNYFLFRDQHAIIKR